MENTGAPLYSLGFYQFFSIRILFSGALLEGAVGEWIVPCPWLNDQIAIIPAFHKFNCTFWCQVQKVRNLWAALQNRLSPALMAKCNDSTTWSGEWWEARAGANWLHLSRTDRLHATIQPNLAQFQVHIQVQQQVHNFRCIISGAEFQVHNFRSSSRCKLRIDWAKAW